MSGGPGGPDVSIRLSGANLAELESATVGLKRMLAERDGVQDIADNNDKGQLELRIRLRPGAAAMGFTVADVANQVRGIVYGLEAHVFADRQEDIDVRVRLDEDTRENLYAVENAWIISPAGLPTPLSEIAEITEGEAYAVIKRVDRQRSITVTADVSPAISPEIVVGAIDLDGLRGDHPSVLVDLAGRQQQQAEAFGSLPLGFLAALVMIYVILAWLFGNYLQPILIMLVIPFGFIGVSWGHYLLGYDLTFFSLIGFVALSGIVVNDSLILVQFYNVERAKGSTVEEAIIAAGRSRLRAILLTTITTALGLTPLILETSFQAKFLVPMAISIAMGLVAATVLVLLVLPCFLQVFDDIRAGAYFMWNGRRRPKRLPTHDDLADEENQIPAAT